MATWPSLKLLDDTWVPELLALSGSLAVLAATVAVLFAYDNSPIFNWHGITLNTIVSILNTSSKGLLLFAVCSSISQSKWAVFSTMRNQMSIFELIDQASRGPLGCLKIVIYQMRQIARLSLHIGPIVILLSTALDPFAQQLVQIDSRVDFEKDAASTSIPLAQRYSRGSSRYIDPDQWSMGSEVFAGKILSASDFALQSAVTFGLSHGTDAVTQQLSVSCPSTNCTWNKFQSLSICSKCTNLDAMVEPSVVNNTVNVEGNTLADLLVWTMIGDRPTLITRLTLPNGLYSDNTVNMTAQMAYRPQDSIAFKDNDLLFFSASFLNVTRDPVNKVSKLVGDGVSVEATECILHYCVNEYESKVVNGLVQEKKHVVTSATRNPNSWAPSQDYTASGNWHANDPLNYVDTNSSVPRTDLQLGDSFNISQVAVNGLSQYLQSLMIPSTAAADSNMILPGIVLIPNDNIPGGGPTVYSPSPMQSFYRSTNLTSTFEGLAISMTNAIRAGADSTPNSTLVGDLGRYTSFYTIQWPWISLSAILIFLAFLDILCMRRWTAKVHAPLLKSTSLAVLACFNPEVVREFAGLLTISEIEKKAKSLVAKIHEDNMRSTSDVRYLLRSSVAEEDFQEIGCRQTASGYAPIKGVGHEDRDVAT